MTYFSPVALEDFSFISSTINDKHMTDSATQYYLANFNWGRLRYSVDDHRNHEFVDQIAEVNSLADRSPGFVWRFITEGDNSLSYAFRGDPQLVVNLSIWENFKCLYDFAYRGPHLAVFKRRSEWFLPDEQPSFVLWWIEIGVVPDIQDAEDKLSILDDRGPSPEAFIFKKTFPSPPKIVQANT